MLKRWLALMVLAVMLAVSPGMAANYYVDLVSGDDGTGDGSTGSPYKTVDGVRTNEVLTGGDEIRVKKSTVTQLSGTCSYTNGSATITSTVDHSSTLADGDLISKNSHTPSGNEAWWSIASISGTTITLDKEYWGATDAAANCYYNTPTSQDYSYWNYSEDGTSESSRIKVLGGWDLGTETRDGYTFIVSTGNYGALYSDNDYHEYAYFVGFYDGGTLSYGAIYASGAGKGCYFHNIYALSQGNGGCAHALLDYGVWDDIYLSGCGSGFFLEDSFGNVFTDIYIYTATYTLTRGGLHMTHNGTNFFDNLNIYNTGDFGIYGSENDQNFFKNVTIDTTADDCVYLSLGHSAWFHTISCSNSSSQGISADDTFYNLVVKSATFTSVSGNDFYVQPRVSTDMDVMHIFATDSSGNVTQYGAEGTISSDTADARSGTAMEISPEVGAGSGAMTAVKIGSTKVTSTASDLTLGVYLKKTSGFDGYAVELFALQDSEWLYAPSRKTLTTSYAQYTVVVSSGDLTLNKYIDLYIAVSGTTGSVFVDDFTASQ